MKQPYRSVLITGASSGLGRGLSLWFAKNRAKVYAAGRRKANLEALAEEAGGAIEPFVLDVAKAKETHDAIRALEVSSGGLDLVIANAGVGNDVDAKKMSWDRVQQIIDTNVTGAAATLAAAIPGMLDRGRGHLVGVSSLAAARGMPKVAAYCASKAFLQILLEGWRLDLKGTGVRVTSLHPGYVKTEMTAQNKSMPFVLEADDAVDRMARAIVRGDAEFWFPWQLSTPIKALKWLPNPVYDFMATGGGRRMRKKLD